MRHRRDPSASTHDQQGPASRALFVLAEILQEASRRLRERSGALPDEHQDLPTGRGVPRLVLTPQEAAEALQISRTQIYALLRRGELKSVKIGKLRRIPLTALRAYVENQEVSERRPVTISRPAKCADAHPREE